MKTTKKVLGVVLALALILNVFAVCSFAMADNAAIELTITPDKASYAPGDTVTFTVSEQTIAEVGDMYLGGTYIVAYSGTDVFSEFAKTNSVTDINLIPIQEGADLTTSSISYTTDVTGPDGDTLGEGYTGCTKIILNDTTTVTFDATGKVDLFTFQLKISDTATPGDYTVGFNAPSFELGNAYVNDGENYGVYTQNPAYSTPYNFSLGSCTVKVAAAEEYKVEEFKQQAKWENVEKTTFSAGFCAKFSAADLGITIADGATDQEVTVGAKVNGGTTYYGDRLYTEGSGVYSFRAVMTGVPVDTTESVSVQFVVSVDGVEYLSDTFSYSLATIKANLPA